MAPAHDDLRLRLVFSGECIKGHDPQAVRRAVASALKLSERHTERLFSGKHIILKQQVDAAYAARQIARFAAMGAVLRMEQGSTHGKSRPPPAKPAFNPAQALRWPPDRLTLGAIGIAALLLVSAGAWFAGWDDGPQQAAAPAAAVTAAPAIARVAPATGLLPVAVASPVSSPLADADMPSSLSTQAASDYRQQYWPAAWHKAFAVSASGAHAWVVGAASEPQAREAALLQCAKTLPSANAGCRVVDVDGEPQD